MKQPKREVVVVEDREEKPQKQAIGENQRLANRKGLGVRYQLDRAAYLTQARAIPVPTGHGITFVPIDVGSYDPDTKTYVNPLDGSRIEAYRTTPLYSE